MNDPLMNMAIVKNFLIRQGAAIESVREIHKPVTHHEQTYCSVCSADGIPESLVYPCPTIKALGDLT